MHRDCTLRTRIIQREADAADKYLHPAVVLYYVQVRGQGREAEQVIDAFIIEVPGGKGGDRQGNILQVLGAPLRGDYYFLQNSLVFLLRVGRNGIEQK